MDHPLVTIFKGALGSSLPIYALVAGVDTWAAPIQAAFGITIPALTIANLWYNLRRNRRIQADMDKEDQRKAQVRAYFKRKHYLKKSKNRKVLTEPEETDSI